jgi:hypothetical protein
MVPDELFDELLPDLSGAELKVLLFVVRRTFGFKRDADRISLSQMLRGVTTREGQILHRGVGLSKPTLLGALRSLRAKGVLRGVRQRSAAKGDEPTVYALRFADADLRDGQADAPPWRAVDPGNRPPVGKKPHQGVGKVLHQGGGQSVCPHNTQGPDRQQGNITPKPPRRPTPRPGPRRRPPRPPPGATSALVMMLPS